MNTSNKTMTPKTNLVKCPCPNCSVAHELPELAYTYTLAGRMKEAEALIKGLHEGWKKARKAHLDTCKNAQADIDALHTENVCLHELVQEFYEWSRRDYPTEQEVRELMNRYHDLLNKPAKSICRP
jgi:hypothetical protein